jgi:hypothetical protein
MSFGILNLLEKRNSHQKRRFIGSLADICSAKGHVRFTPDSDPERGFLRKVMSALPQKRTCAVH